MVVLKSQNCTELVDMVQNAEPWSLEERWQILMDNIKDYAIFMLDPDGKIATWSEGAERILGYKEDEILGHEFCDIFTPEDIGRKQPEAELEGARTRGRAEDERWHVRKDGSRFWASGIVTSLWDDKGNLRGFAKILRDITERKKSEEKLLEQNRRKDEFVAILSHEIRNPLAGIANAVEVLRLQPASPEAIDVIARQTTSLRRIVDDLLDITRITVGKIPLKRTRVNVHDLVERSTRDALQLVQENEQELKVQLPDEPIILDADPDRLEQTIANLLHNAAKYSPPGSKIELKAERVGNELFLSVRDNGIGISTEMLPRVFEMFIQADRTLDRSQGGLGIGLTLAQRIVQMHGGSIEAKSAGIGCGSEFSIRLPIVTDPVVAEVEVTSAAAEKIERAQGAGLKILIAEDNRDSAATMAILLRSLGHQVEIAHDGSEALKVVNAYQPDAFLVDIGLPVIDGYDVAKRVRQQPQLNRTRLIAVTGYGTPEDKERSSVAGFDFHLVKPVPFQALQDLLASFG